MAIIEDAAHSFESRYKGDPPGVHSDAAIFSFYATKNVTCGEGGAIVTRRADLFEAIVQTRLHGMSAGVIDRFAGDRYRHWDMARLGTKANLPDLLAVLLPDLHGARAPQAPRGARSAVRRGVLRNCHPPAENAAWHSQSQAFVSGPCSASAS